MQKAHDAAKAYMSIPQDLEAYGKNLGEILYFVTSDNAELPSKTELSLYWDTWYHQISLI